MRSKLATCLWSIFVLYLGFLLNTSYAQSFYDRQNCQLPDGTDATCVDLRECRPLLDLLKTLRRPHPPSVTRKLSAYQCQTKYKAVFVCCPSEPISLDPKGLYHNRDKAPDVENHKNFHLLPTNCGILDESERITNGEDAFLNEFPFMALLQYKTSHGLQFLCGGTIINYNYILTAAHCLGLAQAELVGVRVGEHSTRNETDCEVQNNEERSIKCNPPVQDLRIEKIIPHPQFAVKDKNVLSDIALLRVSTMKEAINVFPVCLPVGSLRDKPFNYAFVTGWGLTNSRTMERADILQKVSLPIIDQRTCSAQYSESGIELTKTQICAGGMDKKASCSGDSGGPMVAAGFNNGNLIYVQYGIVSVGPIFCEMKNSVPGVYTLVKFYMDWILDNMAP